MTEFEVKTYTRQQNDKERKQARNGRLIGIGISVLALGYSIWWYLSNRDNPTTFIRYMALLIAVYFGYQAVKLLMQYMRTRNETFTWTVKPGEEVLNINGHDLKWEDFGRVKIEGENLAFYNKHTNKLTFRLPYYREFNNSSELLATIATCMGKSIES